MIEGKHDFASVTDLISDKTLKKRTPFQWYIGFAVAFLVAQLMLMTVTYLLVKGVGIWGNNQPIGWAFPIINFVWWIGIGHAGTLISAILLLLNQKWRTSINRFAEAMTLFAVACAGMFPLLHTGRPWLAFWMFPYPNTMGMWPQFQKPSDLGRFRGFDVCDDLAPVLVCRFDSRSGDSARSCQKQVFQNNLRFIVVGLARFGAALASLRIGVSFAGGNFDAARAFGSLHR